MLSAPADFSEELLISTLADGWGIRVASLDYRAVGFGSHHWEVVDDAGARWFATVDELATKLHALSEPLEVGFERLHAALGTARRLHDHGLRFVVAPIRDCRGAAVVRVGERFAVAVYPFISGTSFEWGDFPSAEHRDAVLDLIASLHSAPVDAAPGALADDFSLPHRDELSATLDPDYRPAEQGPYTRAAAQLVASNATLIRSLLERYDRLAQDAHGTRQVLTHGEPRPGNTMRVADGWLLIDWDTALLAPPERDLWWLASDLSGYTERTGITPDASLLELYRIGWDLADLAMYMNQFRAPHLEGPNEATSWTYLNHLVRQLAA